MCFIEIDDILLEKNGDFITLEKEKKWYIVKYEDLLEIIEELKKLFNLKTVRTKKFILRGKKYMAYRLKNCKNYSSRDYSKFKREIFKILFFKYITGFNSYNEDNLKIINENSLIYCDKITKKSNFDYISSQEFENYCNQMVSNYNLIFLRFKIDEIIKKISPNLIYLSAEIIYRMKSLILR